MLLKIQATASAQRSAASWIPERRKQATEEKACRLGTFGVLSGMALYDRIDCHVEAVLIPTIVFPPTGPVVALASSPSQRFIP